MMKKILMATLMGLFAIVGAHAADDDYYANDDWRIRMDSNPMYRPFEGRFYSITGLNTDTDFEIWNATEQFGFGITDNFSVYLTTAGSFDSKHGDRAPETTLRDEWNWDNFGLGTSWRFISDGPWVADIWGQVRQDYMSGAEVLDYNWTGGIKAGFIGWDRWTLAVSAQYDYMKDARAELDYRTQGMMIGLDGLYNFNRHWNFVAGLYGLFDVGSSEVSMYNDDPLMAKLGFDYNFTDWTYLGVYVQKDVRHDFDEAAMDLGVKFGIDF